MARCVSSTAPRIPCARAEFFLPMVAKSSARAPFLPSAKSPVSSTYKNYRKPTSVVQAPCCKSRNRWRRRRVSGLMRRRRWRGRPPRRMHGRARHQQKGAGHTVGAPDGRFGSAASLMSFTNVAGSSLALTPSSIFRSRLLPGNAPLPISAEIAHIY